MSTPDRPPVTLRLRDLGRLAYEPALAVQRQAHAAVRSGASPGVLLLVEHDPVVTLGRRGNRDGILHPDRLRALGVDIVHSERGGDVTYHGPGQLVAYPILNLRQLGLDVRGYVLALEGVVLRLLRTYGIAGRRDPSMHGVFTAAGKIASVGVHVSGGVTRHGVALNVHPISEHWRCIAPCGQPGVIAASLQAELPHPPIASPSLDPPSTETPSMHDVKRRFVRAFAQQFALTVRPQRAPGYSPTQTSARVRQCTHSRSTSDPRSP